MQSSICVTAVNPLPPPETFVGRQPDIDAVKGLIASSAVSLVCGREGMGKTALCKRVFYEIGQQNELGVKAVGWLDYFESVEYTLYGQFPNIKPSPDIFAYARAAEEYLKGFGSDLALFVDNVDIEAMGFPAILAFLSGLGCRVVFLSGNRIRQVPSHYVERLPLADQEGVFRAYCPGFSEDAHIFQSIASHLGGNTLALELFGRAFQRSSLPLPSILEKLEGRPQMDSEPAKAVLWLISEFLDGESIRLLEAFSFLSSGPVGFETIASIFDLTEAKAIFGLMGDAWLEKASPTSLKMHPLIAQAVRAKAMGSQESMRAYFSRFILASRPDALSAAQRLQTLPHAVSFAKWMNNSSAQKARLLANIAQLFGGLRDYGRAQAAFDRALGVLSATEGLKHPFAATLYRSYASTMKAGGQYQKAAQLYDKSAELCMEKYGEGSLALSDTYMDSIGVLVYLDSLDEAMRRAREAHRILSAKFGDSEAATWAAMEKIGLVTLAMGRPGDAIDILESASRALRELLGPSSEALACAWIDLAQAYQADGDYVKSYFFAMRSLDMLKKGKPKNSSLLAKAYATLGRHFQFLQEYDQAVGFMKDALSSLRKAYAENHPEMSLCYLALGRLHREMGMEGKAANYFSRYLSIKEKTVGKNTPAQAFKNIGAVYMELGNKSLTLNYYSKALNIAVNAKGKNHALTAGAYNDLGLAYMYFGEYGASLSNFGKALKIFALLYGENDSTAAVIYNNMALACQNMNDTGSAVEYYARSLAIKEAVLGKRDPHTLSTYSNLYGLYKKMGDSFNADYYKTLFMENGGNSKMIEGEFEI